MARATLLADGFVPEVISNGAVTRAYFPTYILTIWQFLK